MCWNVGPFKEGYIQFREYVGIRDSTPGRESQMEKRLEKKMENEMEARFIQWLIGLRFRARKAQVMSYMLFISTFL